MEPTKLHHVIENRKELGLSFMDLVFLQPDKNGMVSDKELQQARTQKKKAPFAILFMLLIFVIVCLDWDSLTDKQVFTALPVCIGLLGITAYKLK